MNAANSTTAAESLSCNTHLPRSFLLHSNTSVAEVIVGFGKQTSGKTISDSIIAAAAAA